MKKFTRDHIETHNIKNSIIGSRQHGSQQGRLTTTTLLEYLEKLTELLDKGENFNILYMDFAKNFNPVPKEKVGGGGIGGQDSVLVKEGVGQGGGWF